MTPEQIKSVVASEIGDFSVSSAGREVAVTILLPRWQRWLGPFWAERIRCRVRRRLNQQNYCGDNVVVYVRYIKGK